MNLTRRDFLTWLGVGGVSLAIPGPLIDAAAGQCKQAGSDKFKTHADFDPESFHVFALDVGSYPTVDIFQMLISSMEKTVPQSCRRHVRIDMTTGLEDFGRHRTIGWHYYPGQEGSYLGQDGCWVYCENTGCYSWFKRPSGFCLIDSKGKVQTFLDQHA